MKFASFSVAFPMGFFTRNHYSIPRFSINTGESLSLFIQFIDFYCFFVKFIDFYAIFINFWGGSKKGPFFRGFFQFWVRSLGIGGKKGVQIAIRGGVRVNFKKSRKIDFFHPFFSLFFSILAKNVRRKVPPL